MSRLGAGRRFGTRGASLEGSVAAPAGAARVHSGAWPIAAAILSGCGDVFRCPPRPAYSPLGSCRSGPPFAPPGIGPRVPG